jgi:hypothetical protein
MLDCEAIGMDQAYAGNGPDLDFAVDRGVLAGIAGF